MGPATRGVDVGRASKRVTLEQAARLVEDGARVGFGGSNALFSFVAGLRAVEQTGFELTVSGTLGPYDRSER